MATNSPVQSPEDVVNIALGRIGFKGRIGSLYDGSAMARKALDLYGQTRDAVLREFTWGFAERILAASVSGGIAPAPWSYEYVYPTDCILLRSMFNAQYLSDKNDPRPTLWTIASSPTKGKVIWTNVAVATLVYTSQITDPSKWDPQFVERLVSALARRLAGGAGGPEMMKMEAEEEKVTAQISEGLLG